MVSSRKSRILALSAVLLTVVFIFITTQNSSQQPTIRSHSLYSTPPQNVETTTKIGETDESLIKSHEEKLKQKIQDSKNDKTNEIKQQLQLQQQQLDGGVGVASGKISSKPPAAVSAASGSSTGSNGPAIKVDQVDDDEEDDFDAAHEFQSILGLSPVVIFSKTYCGFSKALKNLLKSEYEITPPPTIVELDKHKNGRKLQDYIASKSGRKTVPNIFIGGVSRGGSDELKKLHEDGKLLSTLNLWGEKNIKVTKVNAPSNS